MKTKKHLREEIKELKARLDWQKQENDNLAAANEKLKSIIRGERVCDGYCERCTHHIEKQGQCKSNGFYWYKSIIFDCDLMCRCPDFNRKED